MKNYVTEHTYKLEYNTEKNPELKKWIDKARMLGILDDYVLEFKYTCTVNDNGYIDKFKWVGILSKYKGTNKKPLIPPVDWIISDAFKDNKYIEHIELNNTVSLIGDNAFKGCTNLKTIKLSSNLDNIGECVFYGCNKLIDVDFNNCKLTKLGDMTFIHCDKLENINLPESLIEIGANAFRQSGITSLIIPKNVKIIGSQCFMMCLKLKELTILSDKLEKQGGLRESGYILSFTPVKVLYIKRKYKNFIKLHIDTATLRNTVVIKGI